MRIWLEKPRGSWARVPAASRVPFTPFPGWSGDPRSQDGESYRTRLSLHLSFCAEELFQRLFIDHWSRGWGRGSEGRNPRPPSADRARATFGRVLAEHPQPSASLEAG